MFHSENIAIFAIWLQYFDISVIGFVILFGYCISVFEWYYMSVVNTYILPSPICVLFHLDGYCIHGWCRCFCISQVNCNPIGSWPAFIWEISKLCEFKQDEEGQGLSNVERVLTENINWLNIEDAKNSA